MFTLTSPPVWSLINLTEDDVNVIMQALEGSGPWKVVNPVHQKLMGQLNDPALQPHLPKPTVPPESPDAEQAKT